jgi:hypothetical protein|tara:strand:- start:1066 stop:1452 length:387 start_codon:yes stop_codon:yes gene_type:complete
LPAIGSSKKIEISPKKNADINTDSKLRNADKPDALDIINSFDLVKLILNAKADNITIKGIAKDRYVVVLNKLRINAFRIGFSNPFNLFRLVRKSKSKTSKIIPRSTRINETKKRFVKYIDKVILNSTL